MRIAEQLCGFIVGLITLPMFLLGALMGLRGVGRYMHIKSL
jgi:hypothetical protein